MIAESFKNADERLKYIRNRLSWKKLFSVVVTDMNAVRIELYKRERIKDALNQGQGREHKKKYLNEFLVL